MRLRDTKPFSASSDKLPGVERAYTGLSQAAAEAGQSRIYGGIHFQFSNDAGREAGKSIGQEIVRTRLLRLEDGSYLPESNAILYYLAEGTELLPADRLGRARVLQWMFFEQYTHEPAIAVARFIVGQARTYIRTADEDAGSLDVSAAVERFRAGAVMVSPRPSIWKPIGRLAG